MKGSPQGLAIEMVKDIRIDKALDVGCGSGDFLAYLLGTGMVNEAYGVDLDDRMLREASKRGLSVYRVDLNSDKLPFSPSYFDLVISTDVVEHILNLNNYFSEIHRVLKEEREFVISTPNVQFAYHILRLISGRGPRTSFPVEYRDYGIELYDRGHVHYFTIKDLKELLMKYSFEIMQVRGTYNVSSRLLSRLMKIASKIEPLISYMCPGMVIKATKRHRKIIEKNPRDSLNK